MKFIEKFNMDIQGIIKNGSINIVLFGDSVTHGALNGYYNYDTVYWNLLRQKLNKLRDSVPVNMINSGIGGTSAEGSIARIDRDILSYHPDIVIVCFGLNDINAPLEGYMRGLRIIFERVLECVDNVIFMTPNMLNTYVAEDTKPELCTYAKVTAEYQNSGRMDTYMKAAINLANDMGVRVCDAYGEWKKMYESGVDTTKLLINRINHPVPEMHKLFADMLFDIITKDFDINSESANSMYQGEKK